MPPLSSMYVSPEEMARELIKLLEVIAKVLKEESNEKGDGEVVGQVPPEF